MSNFAPKAILWPRMDSEMLNWSRMDFRTRDNSKDFYLWAGNQPAVPRQTKNIKIRVKHLFDEARRRQTLISS